MKRNPPPRERKELFCGGFVDCTEFARNHARGEDAFDVVRNERGPEYSVYYKRKPTDRTVKAPLRRLTRALFRVQGVTSEPMRPLWVALEPGDVLSFTPRGTRQRVAVPIASLYHHARFIAARAIANERMRARKAKKKGGAK